MSQTISTAIVAASAVHYMPIEIWEQICAHLSVHDILNLRLASSQFNAIATASRIWRRIVVYKWFSVLDLDRSDLYQTTNFFDYYKKRQRTDMEVKGLLFDDIEEFEDHEDFLKAVWQTTKYGEKIIPLLLKLKNEFNREISNNKRISTTTTTQHLSLYYVAEQVLRSLRRKNAFELIYNICYNKIPEANSFTNPANLLLEEFFFKFSYLDPGFDELQQFRSHVIQEIVKFFRLFLEDNNNPQNSSDKLSPTALVKRITETFHMYRHQQFRNHSQAISRFTYTMPALEDSFATRVYAGEATGHSILIASIIQKIALNCNIVCFVSKRFLVVEDPTFEYGYSYNKMTAKSIVSYTLTQVLQQYRVPTLPGNMPLQAVSGPRFCRYIDPVTWDYLLKICYFEYPSIPELLTSFYRDISNGASQSRQTETQYTNEYLALIFPISKCKVQKSDIEQVKLFTYLLKLQLENHHQSQSSSQSQQVTQRLNSNHLRNVLLQSIHDTGGSPHNFAQIAKLKHQFLDNLMLYHIADFPCIKPFWPKLLGPPLDLELFAPVEESIDALTARMSATSTDSTAATSTDDKRRRNSQAVISKQARKFEYFKNLEAEIFSTFEDRFKRHNGLKFAKRNRSRVLHNTTSTPAEINTQSQSQSPRAVLDNEIEPRFKVGDPVYHRRWAEKGIIVGWKKAIRFNRINSASSLSLSTLSSSAVSLQRAAAQATATAASNNDNRMNANAAAATVSGISSDTNVTISTNTNDGIGDSSENGNMNRNGNESFYSINNISSTTHLDDDPLLFLVDIFYTVFLLSSGETNVYAESGLEPFEIVQLPSSKEKEIETEESGESRDLDDDNSDNLGLKGLSWGEDVAGNLHIGKFFKAYDYGKRRFVANSLLRRIYPDL